MSKYVAAMPLCIAILVASACKGETEYKDKPETLQALDKYKGDAVEKEGYIKQLEAKIYDLEKAQKSDGDDDEIIVAIIGDTIEIQKGKTKGPNARKGGPVAKDEELYKEFIAHVSKSRGSIQRCYTNALKKDSSLQGRETTLKLSVRFKDDGSVGKATFNPRISDAFDGCMSGVTKRWTLTGTSQSITFQQPVTLSPQ